MSNQNRSESHKNEPVLKGDHAQMDSSRSSYDKLHQEACQKLSSPPDAESNISPFTDSIFEDRSGEKTKYKIHVAKNVDRDSSEFNRTDKNSNNTKSQKQQSDTNDSLIQIIRHKNGQATSPEIPPAQTTK